MTPDDIKKVEAYLQKTLHADLNLKTRPKAADSVEVYKGNEFLAVIYKDEDEGEVAFQLNMTILPEDL